MDVNVNVATNGSTKEVVLISGLSLLADVEEAENEYILKYPYVVVIGPPNRVALTPLSKFTPAIPTLRIKKDMVLTVVDVPAEVSFQYIKLLASNRRGA